MRAAILFILALFMLQATETTAQVQKRVLVEHFTQASCPPCAAQNPAFNNMLFDNWEKLVTIKYQTSWPGFDPMNEQNPGEVQSRVDYYGVTGVPNVIMGGTLDAGTAGQATVGQIDNIHAEMTPIEMDMSHSISADLDSMFITAVIKNVSADEFNPGNTVAHIAIVEQEILFPEPPGSTDELDFYNVMRKMLPDADGTSLGAIAAGDSVVLAFAVPLPEYIYFYDQLGAIGFVQNNSSQEVYQSDISETLGISDEYGDVSLGLDIQTPPSYCEYEVSASAEVENASDTEVNTIEVQMIINGETIASETWEGTLAQGESATINFAAVAVEPGASEVSFEVISINGLPDYNRMNQLDNSVQVNTLSEEPFATEHMEGFETTPNLVTPANALIEASAPDRMGVINAGYFQQNGQIGAYGESNKAIFANFYQWNNAGEQSHLIFDKLDLTEMTDAIITFDYAFAQYSGFATNDRLIVSVSEDCGATWTTVYNEGGASFATAPASEPFFIAGSGDWAADTIDLSAYDGTAELNVRFSAQTDWGNNLFLDNITIESGTVVSADEANKLEGKVFTYPNPATDLVYVDFTLEEKSDVTVQVFDVSGKAITTLAANVALGTGAHQLRWAPQEAGLYLIRVSTPDSALTKRVTVVK
ncbi:MAG: T9SS type A sorting domain-containing protein [bacterium]|nr:T9SS type A sorting domain-containing protein [bacterium]